MEFAEENEILAVYLPPAKAFIPFRVKAIVNKGYEEINYGAIPLSAGTSLNTFDGGAATVPAYGVMPARAYTPNGISFPAPSEIASSVIQATDMWYTNESLAHRLFHVITLVTPAFLRMDIQIPKNVPQISFQGEKATMGIDKTFGFKRGKVETVIIPCVNYGWRFGNDTNMSVYTFVRFIYREYDIEIVKDPELIFNIAIQRFPAKWKTLQMSTLDPVVKSALERDYGADFKGFPIYSVYERDKAVSEYREIVRKLRM
ncbi:MAG: hypothetical protein DSO07_02980 [Thermoproteota archaeon]|nr:MAG: hypothetical protein DSO07_02980 [Candidatus Korarchaeota archaeon]